ncbi:MAG: CpaF family protein [Anaerolineales bacterium]|nr:CpaF family protein [Anaerolineales bacterium]
MSTPDNINSWGPLESLLNDPEVQEILVDGPYRVYIERKGKLKDVNIQFQDNEHLLTLINDILAFLGQKVDQTYPMVDTRLPDGSRINVVIPPLALNGPTLTIRKSTRNPLTLDDLIRFDSMSAEIAEFLKACVKARLNMLISGGTGSGKTTLFNVLCSFISDDERIIVIERAAELKLPQRRVVILEARPANLEGKGEVTVRDLLLNSLKMRPDRVIIGDIEGNEVFDFLQAMNSGHDGSMTSLHAQSPSDAIARLETLVTLGNLSTPVLTVREMIASGIDLIVHQERLRDGSRKILKVTEVEGIHDGVVVLSDIFEFRETGVEGGRIRGRIVPTGHIPRFVSRLDAAGSQLPLSLFDPPQEADKHEA